MAERISTFTIRLMREDTWEEGKQEEWDDENQEAFDEFSSALNDIENQLSEMAPEGFYVKIDE